MSELVPPPIYSQEVPDDETRSEVLEGTVDTTPEPQILISPTVDAINFQKGYLGSDDERAAIEGEVQIKGAEPGAWSKVTVALHTVESAYERDIELGLSEVVLYSSSESSSGSVLPSSLLFSIPLMQDTPQTIQTPNSSLIHTLTAVLHPFDLAACPVSKSLQVHTKRYTSHALSIPTSPETHVLDDPTRIQVEIPRVTFASDEVIPVYVTIPPPNRELVDQGLRLRNVRAELVRTIKVRRDGGEDDDGSEWEPETPVDEELGYNFSEGPSMIQASLEKSREARDTAAPLSPLFFGSSYRAVVSRSGAQCRFHSTRSVQLRFILRNPSPSGSPSDYPVNLPSLAQGSLNSDAECASITQSTLLHSVTFKLNVHVSFVDISSRTERVSTITIPITLLPPPAPLPEIAPSMDIAYQKKHDRPPDKTNRWEEADLSSAPRYSEGEPGPSALHSGAPPPFEERDAPPPFFPHAAEASSSRLPTFLESESEIIIPPDSTTQSMALATHPPTVVGEGYEFGFTASEQFDGHSEDMQRSLTPPPTLEMATMDTDVTQLAEMPEPERSIEALGIVLEQREGSARGDPPPPPPAMDDPSDPPPSIDSDFRSPPDQPGQRRRQTSPPPPHTSPPLHPAYAPPDIPRLQTPVPSAPSQHSTPHGHAPPPYLVPENHREQESVTRPPPYVD